MPSSGTRPERAEERMGKREMDKPIWTNCPVMEQRNELIVKKDVGLRVVLIW